MVDDIEQGRRWPGGSGPSLDQDDPREGQEG
jgi:hypothetical protein